MNDLELITTRYREEFIRSLNAIGKARKMDEVLSEIPRAFALGAVYNAFAMLLNHGSSLVLSEQSRKEFGLPPGRQDQQ